MRKRQERLEKVALRKESVDRNARHIYYVSAGQGVALRKESVDRNYCAQTSRAFGKMSLSARRAWIEMGFRAFDCWQSTVALRKESVDRNRHYRYDVSDLGVALRKESVDRNST